MTPEISQALQASVLVGVVVRPLIVAVLLVGFWMGLGRAGRRGARRVFPWTTFAVIVIAWVSTVWTLSARGAFVSVANAGVPAAGTHILLPIIGIAVGGLILLMRSDTMAGVVDAVPLWWLVAFQSYRITGFIFLRLWSNHFLPGYFALPAGIGDTLTGVFAIGVAIALQRETPSARKLAYAVNIFGLADLITAVSMGMLTAAKSPAGMSPMLVYPLSIVPTFGVPLAVIIHCLSLWQLNRRNRRPAGEIRVHHDHSVGQAHA